MDEAQRSSMMEQLRAMAAGRGDGIDLDSADQWVVGNLTEPAVFFRELAVLIPSDSVLYFEGCDMVPEVARFYESHRATNAIAVVRDTVFPIPETFHVSMNPEVLSGMVDLLGRWSREQCFYHVKAYREEKLLFTFHDAFDGSPLLISDRVPEEAVRVFCANCGVTCQRERNESKRDPEQLRHLLWAMENPEKLRMNWPWWKKLLFFWRT